MAERRMFTKKITESDSFLDMPLSTQALYFHINMAADDEGFVNNPKKIQRMIGASEDDLKLLIAKSFLISYESGVLVIKHWKMHNYIQKDRFHPTVYQEERKCLKVKQNGAYTLNDSEVDTKCIQDVSKMDTEVRLGKVSIGKDNNNTSTEAADKIISDFGEIYKLYPKKVGKAKAIKAYRQWVTVGRDDGTGKKRKLTNKQIWKAVRLYCDEHENTERQYWKDFNTLMNNITDYVREEE